jgi:hypothetical protein
LLLTLALPATDLTVSSITASPGPVAKGSSAVASGLYFDGGGLLFVSSPGRSQTVFDASSGATMDAYLPGLEENALGSFGEAAASPGKRPKGVGCLKCHGDIEDITANMRWHGFKKCVDCHGGNRKATTKEEAHVQPTLPVIMDDTVPPLDYDLAYQRFVNPSNLRVVDETCGSCHAHRDEVSVIEKGLMATAAGHHAGGLYLNGVTDTKTPIYGTFAVSDDDGEVPFEKGAVDNLEDLITFDPRDDPSEFATHYKAVPGQACARCHLWSRGKGYRGAVGAEGVYRADGCAACHMIYANDGLSRSADPSIDHTEPGHPMTHIITKAIPSDQCIHCHHRGARIGLSFTGRAQMPPNLPSGPGVPGTTDVKFNGNYHYSDQETNPPDLHHAAGLHCIDCHTKNGVMGDGNIYGHMDQATKIRCRTCHGLPTSLGTLIDEDGLELNNVTANRDRSVVLTSKVTGQQYAIGQVMNVVDPGSVDYDPTAACAMNENHLKQDGGLECYACHTSWAPNCFGCHFERDEREMGRNLVTREWEVGKASTANKVFESLKHFSMGKNRKGRFSPYVVGCNAIADVTAPDGSKILDFVMPETVNGLSGLALNPVNPHTVRAEGEVRSCSECHRSPPTLGLGSGNYALARTNAYVATDGGVQVFDRETDPAVPSPVGTLSSGTPLAVAALPNVIEGDADYLFVAAGTAGLWIYDMRAGIPADPVAVVDGINAIDVSRAAHYLYVVVEGVGVNIYDNQDPSTANLVATVSIPTAVRAVPWGIHLFVAAGLEGLAVVDIANHDDPGIVGSLPGMNAVDVTLYAHFQKGNGFAARAYVADPDFGVRVVDLLPDFSAPVLRDGLALPGAVALDTYTRYVLADDTTPSREHDYLYVAAGMSGLRVYDITIPDTIAQIAALGLGGHAMDVDVTSQMNPPGTDDYALVANDLAGVQVIDVTDPLNPTLRGTVPAGGATRVLVDVQQLDRFIDEQGNQLKENSHPGVQVLNREEIVSILSTDLGGCATGP